jgi:hypothetical protein
MKLSGMAVRAAVLFVSFFALAGLVQGQYRASLRGTVTDPQGAAVVGAKVTLVNTDTNGTLESISDANGIYQFNALPPAPYRLTVEATGFKQKVLENVRIIPEQPNALDLPLEVGEVQQTVTVSGTTQALDTETATVSGTITSNQVQHMPSFGRDVFQLIRLAPGVFGDGAQNVGTGINLPGTQGPGATGGNQGIFQTENGPQALAAGQQYENNSITIDGISTTSAVWGGTTIITPTEDSVDNVKVVSNGYDAELGRFSGAQIQVISKGGSNQFHGSAFFTAHRPGLNAYQSFNGQGNKVLRDTDFFDQFGGSLGGPIWKNKIFAFFAWETVRSPKAQTNISNQWYETSEFDASAPSGSIAAKYLSFPGNSVPNLGINANATCQNAGLSEGVNCVTIPGKGLDVGSPLKTPLGTQDLTWQSSGNPGIGGGFDGIPDIANYITSSTSNFSKNQYNGRLDANITAKDRIAFAIYWVPTSTNNLNGFRGYDLFHHEQINEAYSAIWDRTISSSFLNEARVNAAGWHWNEIASNPQSPIGLPVDMIGQTGSITIGSFGPPVGSIFNQWTYSFKDVATKIIGRHTIKFGGELTRLFYLQNCVGCGGVPNYTFFNLWDFLNDAPHAESASFNPTNGTLTTQRQDDRENIWGFFAQDDFKLRRNLTINAGLRWSYFSPLRSKENNMFVAVPGAGANFLTSLTVRKGDSWNAQKDNFGPQIGFAWSPGKFNDRLVVRGGYGLNYNQEEIAVSSNIVNNPGLVVFPTFSMSTPTSPNPGIIYATATDLHSYTSYPPNPNAVTSFGPNGLPTTGRVNVSIFPGTLPTMRVHHYSVDTQLNLGQNVIATLGYVGSVSHNIFFHQNPNATPAASGFTLNPQIGGGDYWSVLGHGNYNAMLAGLRHQFSRQFSLDAQFSWAKSLDTASSPYSTSFPPFNQPFYPFNVNLNYGRSDYDVGKAFKIYGIWQPIFFHGSKAWIEKIAGDWTLSGIFTVHSGFPWYPELTISGSLYCGTCGYTTLLPAAYLGGAGTSTGNDAFKTGSNYPLGGAAYFTTPTYTSYSGTSFGNANPQTPGVRRNSLAGPGYKDLDLTLAKGFGLPNMRVLGENARFEFRLDAYNVFNNLNFNPTSISNNIASANFGQAMTALAGRIATLGVRFSF